MDFHGKTVLITGGASGMGAATARGVEVGRRFGDIAKEHGISPAQKTKASFDGQAALE